jgi:hypothetical protein
MTTENNKTTENNEDSENRNLLARLAILEQIAHIVLDKEEKTKKAN